MKHIDWVWMTHPTRNNGNPIPVQILEEDGVIYYKPFDEGATEFEMAEIDADWAAAVPPQTCFGEANRILEFHGMRGKT